MMESVKVNPPSVIEPHSSVKRSVESILDKTRSVSSRRVTKKIRTRPVSASISLFDDIDDVSDCYPSVESDSSDGETPDCASDGSTTDIDCNILDFTSSSRTVTSKDNIAPTESLRNSHAVENGHGHTTLARNGLLLSVNNKVIIQDKSTIASTNISDSMPVPMGIFKNNCVTAVTGACEVVPKLQLRLKRDGNDNGGSEWTERSSQKGSPPIWETNPMKINGTKNISVDDASKKHAASTYKLSRAENLPIEFVRNSPAITTLSSSFDQDRSSDSRRCSPIFSDTDTNSVDSSVVQKVAPLNPTSATSSVFKPVADMLPIVSLSQLDVHEKMAPFRGNVYRISKRSTEIEDKEEEEEFELFGEISKAKRVKESPRDKVALSPPPIRARPARTKTQYSLRPSGTVKKKQSACDNSVNQDVDVVADSLQTSGTVKKKQSISEVSLANQGTDIVADGLSSSDPNVKSVEDEQLHVLDSAELALSARKTPSSRIAARQVQKKKSSQCAPKCETKPARSTRSRVVQNTSGSAITSLQSVSVVIEAVDPERVTSTSEIKSTAADDDNNARILNSKKSSSFCTNSNKKTSRPADNQISPIASVLSDNVVTQITTRPPVTTTTATVPKSKLSKATASLVNKPMFVKLKTLCRSVKTTSLKSKKATAASALSNIEPAVPVTADKLNEIDACSAVESLLTEEFNLTATRECIEDETKVGLEEDPGNISDLKGNDSVSTFDESGANVRPPLPTRPLTSYMKFSKMVWKAEAALLQTMGMGEAGAYVGRKWREISDVERKRFIDQYKVDMLRYQKQLNRYLQRYGLRAKDLVKIRSEDKQRASDLKEKTSTRSRRSKSAKSALSLDEPPGSSASCSEEDSSSRQLTNDEVAEEMARNLLHSAGINTTEFRLDNPEMYETTGYSINQSTGVVNEWGRATVVEGQRLQLVSANGTSWCIPFDQSQPLAGGFVPVDISSAYGEQTSYTYGSISSSDLPSTIDSSWLWSQQNSSSNDDVTNQQQHLITAQDSTQTMINMQSSAKYIESTTCETTTGASGFRICDGYASTGTSQPDSSAFYQPCTSGYQVEPGVVYEVVGDGGGGGRVYEVGEAFDGGGIRENSVLGAHDSGSMYQINQLYRGCETNATPDIEKSWNCGSLEIPYVKTEGFVDVEKVQLRSALAEKTKECDRLTGELQQAYLIIHQLQQLQPLQSLVAEQLYAELLQPEQTFTEQLQSSQTFTEHLQTEQTFTEQLQIEQTFTEQLQPERTFTEQLPTEQKFTKHIQTEEQTFTEQLQPEETFTEQLQTEQTFMEHVQTKEQAFTELLKPVPTFTELLLHTEQLGLQGGQLEPEQQYTESLKQDQLQPLELQSEQQEQLQPLDSIQLQQLEPVQLQQMESVQLHPLQLVQLQSEQHDIYAEHSVSRIGDTVEYAPVLWAQEAEDNVGQEDSGLNNTQSEDTNALSAS